MQQVTTFDIALEDGIIVDGKLQDISSKLRGQVLGIWNCLQRALPAPVDRKPSSEPQAPSDYYDGAYERVSASVPLSSFRGMV